MLSRRSWFSRLRNAVVASALPSLFGVSTARALPAGEDAKEEAAAQPSEGFRAMPLDNHPYGKPPITFGQRHGITVIVKTASDLVRSLVPAPLEPAGTELMVQQHMNAITHPLRVRYPNATVIVPVSLEETQGFYMARVYEGGADATMLTIWGREIWGFPKVAADTDVWRNENRATSYLRATNATADVQLALGEETTQEAAGTLPLFCRKTIPSANNQGPDLDRIIQVPWQHTAEQRTAGDVKRFHVRLDRHGKSVELPVEEFVEAFWFTQAAGTVLDLGEVVHDYLA